MRFNYSKGLKPKYLVGIYNWHCEDQYLFHYWNEAKAFYNRVIAEGQEAGTTVCIYERIKDGVRKAYHQF